MPQKPSGKKLSILNCLKKIGKGKTIGGVASIHFRLLSKFELKIKVHEEFSKNR
jgi:hypothetical protein